MEDLHLQLWIEHIHISWVGSTPADIENCGIRQHRTVTLFGRHVLVELSLRITSCVELQCRGPLWCQIITHHMVPVFADDYPSAAASPADPHHPHIICLYS